MSEDLQKKIFAQNLLKYISSSGKSQKEIADAIKVSPQTFNTWCQGIALPRMGKVQLLADYFHISKSDLLDAHQAPPKKNPVIHFVNSEGQEQNFDINSVIYSIMESVSKMAPEQLELVNNMVGGKKIHIVENPQNRKKPSARYGSSTMPLYVAEESAPYGVNAAHARTDVPITDEDVQNDEDIMDGDNF